MGAATRRRDVVAPDGMRLALDCAGDPAAPAVVFLHGGGQSRRAWSRAVVLVAARGLQAVSMDLRGHGDSGWAADGDYHLAAYVRDLRAVLRSLPAPATLVGASLGGNISMACAAQAGPDVVDRLVVVDSTPRVNLDHSLRIRRFLAVAGEGFATVEEAAEALAGLQGEQRPANLDGLRRALRSGPGGRLFLPWDPKLAVPDVIADTADEAKLSAAASGVGVPTLLIRAGRSELVTAEGVEHLRGLIPGLQVVVAEGARHMLTGDQNTEFAGMVLDFLDRTKPGTAAYRMAGADGGAAVRTATLL